MWVINWIKGMWQWLVVILTEGENLTPSFSRTSFFIWLVWIITGIPFGVFLLCYFDYMKDIPREFWNPFFVFLGGVTVVLGTIYGVKSVLGGNLNTAGGILTTVKDIYSNITGNTTAATPRPVTPVTVEPPKTETVRPPVTPEKEG